MTEANQDGLRARVERLWRKGYQTEVSEPVARAATFVVGVGALKALLEQPIFAAIVVSLGCLIWIADQWCEVGRDKAISNTLRD